MTKEEFLKEVRKKIKYIFDRDKIESELNDHIKESIIDLMQDGYEYEKAEEIAVEQMGDPSEIGKMLNKEHHPVLGYCLLSTRILIVLLILPIIFKVGIILYNGIEILTPTTIDTSIKDYKVNLEIEIPSHDIVIDKICINEKNEYYLTYRSFVNKSYSRINWSNQINIFDSNGDYLGRKSFSSHGYFGSYGAINFDYPNDDVVVLKFRNNEEVEINLKEYLYEKD